MKSEHVTFHLQYKHSGTFANLKNCLTPKTRKTCDPILVTLLKIRPCYSQSSRGNCNPNQRHIPISLNNPGHWSIIFWLFIFKNHKIGFPLEMEFCLRFRLTCHCDPDCDPDRVTPIVKCMVITAHIGQTSHKKKDFFLFWPGYS